MLGEVLEWLQVRPEGSYLDATAGTGGHLLAIARQLTTGRVVGLDRDPNALALARERLQEFENEEFQDKVTLVQASFSTIDDVARDLSIPLLDGVLADLGISTLELDTPERGFSFRWNAPLDMRMDPESDLTADDIV